MLRYTPNPGRRVDPSTSMPLPDEAAEEMGNATPGAEPSDAQIKSNPRRNEAVGDGRPTRRWSETVDVERGEGRGQGERGPAV